MIRLVQADEYCRLVSYDRHEEREEAVKLLMEPVPNQSIDLDLRPTEPHEATCVCRVQPGYVGSRP